MEQGPEQQEGIDEKTFPGRLNQLVPISEFVTAAARRYGMDDDGVFAIQMAVDEAATNIILHGYGDQDQGPVHVACWREGDSMVVQLRDHGQPFDPSQIPEPDLDTPLEERQEGGLGVYLIRRLMDRIQFVRTKDQNVLTMTRHLIPRAGLAVRTPVVRPVGRIDATRSAEMQTTLREPLDKGQRHLIVDLSDVTYISSSGLRVLLVLAKEMQERGGELLLCCPQPNVARVLRISGFIDIFAVYETRDAALHALEEAHD